MYEGIIKSLLKFFAVFSLLKEEENPQAEKLFVEDYLGENFNSELTSMYVMEYVQYYTFYKDSLLIQKKENLIDDIKIIQGFIDEICLDINKEYDIETKLTILIKLYSFIFNDKVVDEQEQLFSEYSAQQLRIPLETTKNLQAFCLMPPEDLPQKSWGMLVDKNDATTIKGMRHLCNPNQEVQIYILRIPLVEIIFFRYWGPRNLYLNQQKVAQERAYVLPQGSVLKTSKIKPIYYSKVLSLFIENKNQPSIAFRAENIEHRFSRKVIGLHPISFIENSGNLVGILGGSGVGKSTLLNVLNGTLKLSKGTITINGYDLHKDKEILKGVIGYVPQDDLLIEELTVYQNLYYNAKLCFKDFSDDDINKIIDISLVDFDLIEARDLIVGSPLHKVISGGQRKRLNLALELIREPSVLFVDEPTSGLSSRDSEKVMHLLKKQCLKGKLIFANIHQPSSDIFKMLDKLIVMDSGGRIIFYGNPTDAITYFKDEAHYVNPNESECPTCGTIKTEQPLRIIEARMVTPSGRIIRKRKINPSEWYDKFKRKLQPVLNGQLSRDVVFKKRLPDNIFKIPDRIEQFKLFLRRDLKAKLGNTQYLAIAILEAPLLAFILSFFSKFSQGTTYDFSKNDNLPSYLFMSVVVSLFIGLTISAEEIFRDRRVLKREQFLNLSRSAYLSSKVSIMFFLSAVQILFYVLIGNGIMGIQDMGFTYWLVLFSTACFANLLGLNLSAGLNSIVAIYILIPLMLVPQLLFSGVIINFNKMNPNLSSQEYTPTIGDAMVSRWSFEALAVSQFCYNDYEKPLFKFELEKQDLSFRLYEVVPQLLTQIEGSQIDFRLIANELNKIGFYYIDNWKNLTSEELSNMSPRKIAMVITDIKKDLNSKYKVALSEFNSELSTQIESKGGKDSFLVHKSKYTNKKLDELLKQRQQFESQIIVGSNIVRRNNPIFFKPYNKIGKAHFLTPFKRVFNTTISTLSFNLLVIWLLNIALAVILYFDILKIAIIRLEHFKLNRHSKRKE